MLAYAGAHPNAWIGIVASLVCAALVGCHAAWPVAYRRREEGAPEKVGHGRRRTRRGRRLVLAPLVRGQGHSGHVRCQAPDMAANDTAIARTRLTAPTALSLRSETDMSGAWHRTCLVWPRP